MLKGRRLRSYFRNSACLLILIPIVLIISSSVYPAIISGIQNKEMAIIADALAQLQDKNSRGDSSNYHADVYASDITSLSPSPTPTIPTPPPLRSDDTANNNKDLTTQATLGSVSTRPTNNIVNTNSFYDVVFVTTASGVIKRIQVTFPAGTIVPSSASLNEAEGIGPGTVSKSGQTLTYTVTNAVNIPTGTKIRLEFSNINNPVNPSANYKVTVTTRNAANVVIDGPTQSAAYSMKQIGTNAIADNSITSPKLSIDLAHIVWADETSTGFFDILNARDIISSQAPFVDTYTPPADIGNSIELFSEPSIAASGNNVYVVWQDELPGNNNEIFYRRSIDGGASFGSTINLSNNVGSSFTASVAASGNNVYVVWEDTTPTPGSTEILFKRSTNGGVSFGGTINLSNNAGTSGRPSVAASGNNVYVVWNDGTPGNNEIFYRRSINGGTTFGSIVNLSNNAGSSFVPVVAASGNNVYSVWQDATQGNVCCEIFYRRSTDGGANFGSTINFSNNVGTSVQPAVAASGNNVYMAWFDDSGPQPNSDIFYIRSTDGGSTFSGVINLSNSPTLSRAPAIAAS